MQALFAQQAEALRKGLYASVLHPQVEEEVRPQAKNVWLEQANAFLLKASDMAHKTGTELFSLEADKFNFDLMMPPATSTCNIIVAPTHAASPDEAPPSKECSCCQMTWVSIVLTLLSFLSTH